MDWIALPIALSLLVAQEVFAPTPNSNLISSVGQLGIMAGLVVFFVYQSKQREDRMASRMDHVQTFVQTEMLAAIKDESTALRESNQLTKECSKVIEENTIVMKRLELVLESCQILPPKKL